MSPPILESRGSPDLPPPPHTRQKRVSKRLCSGWSVVGACEVDESIFEEHIARLSRVPLIPSSSEFLLSTSSIKTANPLTAWSSIGHHHLHFTRHDVMTAYREQRIIETPEFTSMKGELGQTYSYPNPTSSTDDSDAFYHEIHRKYERHEKRQRLREQKEISYALYKVRERITQLENMESIDFLHAAASKFAVDAAVNGVATEYRVSCPLSEGKRRQQEMLLSARALEERYQSALVASKVILVQQPCLSVSRTDTLDKEEERVEEDGNEHHLFHVHLSHSRQSPPKERRRPPKKRRKPELPMTVAQITQGYGPAYKQRNPTDDRELIGKAIGRVVRRNVWVSETHLLRTTDAAAPMIRRLPHQVALVLKPQRWSTFDGQIQFFEMP
ncbi:hypothetical protein R3P38DRAFT_2800914 [Favolaschia claudopus]|uniref:Uncharacterized protein n=1 Tax=Favolaschia claudopus TaxID=2862362 RepID=A0AAV9ZW20_9AGAR